MSKIKTSWVLGLVIGAVLLLTNIFPIIQIFSFVPVVLIAETVRENIGQGNADLCIKAYELVSIYLKMILAAIVICCIVIVYKRPKFDIVHETLLMFFAYVVTNGFLAIDIISPQHFCNGDGQTILGIFYSAPFASITPIVLGFLFDLIRVIRLKGKTD